MNDDEWWTGTVRAVLGPFSPDLKSPSVGANFFATPAFEEDTKKEEKVASATRKAVIKQELARLQAELAHLNRFPEDDFANDTVLQVVKTYRRPVPQQSPTGRTVFDPNSSVFAEQQYTYVLLKANGVWWCTGENGHQINGASWEKVIEFVGDDDLVDVRTGLSVMTDALVDYIGENNAAQVDEFLSNPSTGVAATRKVKNDARDGEAPAADPRSPDDDR